MNLHETKTSSLYLSEYLSSGMVENTVGKTVMKLVIVRVVQLVLETVEQLVLEVVEQLLVGA